MGVMVQCAIGETKTQVTTTSVAQASLVNLTNGDMAIWVGSNTADRQQELESQLKTCLAALSNINTIANAEVTAYIGIGEAKSAVVVSDAASIPAPIDESDVAVIIDKIFATTPGARTRIMQDTFTRLLEVLKEDTLKGL